MAGHNTNPSGAHTHKASGGTFGLPKGAAKPDASKFRLKNTGNIILPDCKFSNHSLKKAIQKIKFEISMIKTFELEVVIFCILVRNSYFSNNFDFSNPFFLF